MAKNLYVGNLPWKMTEEELKTTFAAHGQVLSARIITDRETGRARGFGFVEVDDNDAAKIIQAMNDSELDGRKIVVNEARPKTGRS